MTSHTSLNDALVPPAFGEGLAEGLNPAVPPARPLTGLGRGMGWAYVQLAATSIGGLITTMFILRRLGAGDFGVFALITAASAFVSTLDLGLGLAVVRAAAREQESSTETERLEARRDVAAAQGLYVALGLVSIVFMGVMALLLPAVVQGSAASPAEVQATAVLVGLGLGLSIATSALGGLAIGRRNFRSLAVASILGTAVGLAVVFAFSGPLGLVTLGLAEIAASLCTRGWLWVWARRQVPWFRMRPARLSRVDFRRVVVVALPLVMLSVGGQVIATTDLFILGGLYSATVVGLYRVGSLLPTQAIVVLYQGYDVVLPALAGTDNRSAQEHTVAFLTRVGCYLGGVGLGTLALLRNDVIDLVNGRPSSLAASVLLVFCGIWLMTLVSHGLGLLLIARGRQRVMLLPVLAEIMVNVVATLILLNLLGPIGAAVATLLTLGLSHVLLLPWIARRELNISAARLVAVDGWLSVAVGTAVAGAAFLTVSGMAPSATRLVAGSVVALVLGVGAGAALLQASGRHRLRALLRRVDALSPC